MEKTIVMIIAMLLMTSPVLAEDMQMDHVMKHGDMKGMMGMHSEMARTEDARTSLNLPAPMRYKQLVMMREHLQAVNDIIAYIAEGKFDTASETAHKKLGLTPEMKQMCNMFGNNDFRMIGLSFHQSADELGDVLQTGNVKRSLAALHRTMDKCVSCHATFRQ